MVDCVYYSGSLKTRVLSCSSWEELPELGPFPFLRKKKGTCRRMNLR